MKTTLQVSQMLGVKPYTLTRSIISGSFKVDGIAEKTGGIYIWTGTEKEIKARFKNFDSKRKSGLGRPKLDRIVCDKCGSIIKKKKGDK